MNDFQKRLLQAMAEKKISASDLSKMTGIDKGSLSNYINGKYVAKQDKAFALAKALDVDAGWLMTGDEPLKKELVSSFSMPFHPDILEMLDASIQESETKRQIRDRERQDELKLIKIFDSLTSEGKQYMMQQAEIAKKMFGKE